jgi:putative peptidoglycan lipid II flippase
MDRSTGETQPWMGRGAALITIATAISRLTGLMRVVVVAYAMGATFLTDTYNSANTAPNLVFELVAAGVLTSVFVPTFVDHIVKGKEKDTWEAGNAMTSVALVALIGISLLVMLLAPAIMRLLLVGRAEDQAEAVAVGTDLLRLFAPQIIFYGVGMIMTGALHAHRRFGMAAVAPIFNNVVVIGVYLIYAAMRGESAPSIDSVTSAQIWVLGAGTTLGVVAMTLCLVPSLRRLGWHFRFRPDVRHPSVTRGARLGAWALGYAGGYQAGLIVVLILANRIQGGVAGYQWAYTFFYLPHALFGAPIFNVLFTAMAEHEAKGQRTAVAERLKQGLAMLGFILVPVATGLAVLAYAISTTTLDYGVMNRSGVDLVARVMIGFAPGLPFYSAFLVFTRGFYAIGDARTPALVNLATVGLTTAIGAAAFFALPSGWEVAGLAFGHSAGFLVGAVVLGALLRRRLGAQSPLADLPVLLRHVLSAAVAGVAMTGVVSFFDTGVKEQALAAIALGAVVGALLYTGVAVAVGAGEPARLLALTRSFRGRR